MALSYSHKLGELIGDFFESSIIQYLNPIVTKQGYYLDYKHPRSARDGKREVIGTDSDGNHHKLDIVIEDGGSDSVIGKPVAFIEMAWRRYVKHSKAKVQEIAGAIMPLVRTYHQQAPFYAAVLSGEFTENALQQLTSQGFYVIHFSYKDMIDIFSSVNISIVWEEDSNESVMKRIAHKIESLSNRKRVILQKAFFEKQATKLQALAQELERAFSKKISQVIVLPIHGTASSLTTIDDAISFISNYEESSCNASLLRYEITIRYNNDDRITMECSNKRDAIQFLNQYT